MNNSRRKEIARIQAEVESALDTLNGLKGDLEDVRDEEQEAFDNMPESLQDSDRGQASQAAIEALEEAINALDDVTEAGVSGSLDTAAE